MTQFRVPNTSFPFISALGAQTTLPPGNYSFNDGSFLKKKKIDFMIVCQPHGAMITS